MYQVVCIRYKISKICIVLGAMLTTLYLLHTTAAFAKAAFSVSISPPVIKIETKPDKEISTPITITNNTQETQDLEIILKPFISEEDGHVRYISEEEAFSQKGDQNIFDKIRIKDDENPVNEITVPPLGEKKLILYLAIPKEETESDYYFSIIFKSKNNQNISDDKTQSVSLGGIATHVLLSVGSNKKPFGTLDTFSGPLFIEKGPALFTVKIKNDSDHFITTNGVITIKNMFGQAVGNIELDPTVILAHSSRFIPDRLHSVSIVWPESFLAGWYNASLSISLSDDGPVFIRNLYFGALPLYIILPIGITGVVALFILKRIKSKQPT